MDFEFGMFDFDHNDALSDFSTFDSPNNSDFFFCNSPNDWSSLPKFQQPLFKTQIDNSIKKPQRVKKVFKCDECNKEYKSKENYLLHYSNKHLKQKPYKCRFCSMRYSHRNGRRYHEKNHHTEQDSQDAQLTHLSHLVQA